MMLTGLRWRRCARTRQEWWRDRLAREPDDLDDGETAATADSDDHYSFLEVEVPPGSKPARKELANRPLIRKQAFGEALDKSKPLNNKINPWRARRGLNSQPSVSKTDTLSS
jgi:hypothetical protein